MLAFTDSILLTLIFLSASNTNLELFVAIAWSQIRDDNNKDVDWLICGYEGNSKTDIGLIKKGSGGLEACAKELPDGEPIFGGCRLNKKGRFVKFYYCSENTSAMKKGRAGMHKNGEFSLAKVYSVKKGDLTFLLICLSTRSTECIGRMRWRNQHSARYDRGRHRKDLLTY